MGDDVLRCPLCCDRTFESKPELVEHLAIILDSISCPICNSKWSSVPLLIEHLTLDNCQADNTTHTINFDIIPDPETNQHVENINQNLDSTQIHQITNEHQEELSDQLSTTINQVADNGSDMGRVYVEFLSKQLTKPCLQTQELKLVKDDGGVSRYVFMVDENDANTGVDVGSAVITKQNNDGTISLTTVRVQPSPAIIPDMKMETSDTLTSQEAEEPVEENQEEIYSCNTCGVSFTSVLEHIQNYHNNEDVVVEETMEEVETDPNEVLEAPLLHAKSTAEEIPEVKQDSRRMITDTGDIIEAPILLKTESDGSSFAQRALTTAPAEGSDPPNTNRQLVVVDSVVREIKQTDDKTGPYHKVVIKEITRPNGDKVKIFNCMSCHIYVSTLDEFKSHPCKQFKYSCPHCPVAYENCKSLCAHMKVHKSKPSIDELITEPSPTKTIYTCGVCNTIFLTNKSLKLHKRMHDPIKSRPIEPPVETADGLVVSNDKFLCSVCNKLIPIDYRAVHQRSHRTKPGLSCEICNKEFQAEEYLEMHMNVHMGDKAPTNRQDSRSLPYTCVYCDRRFSRPHEKVKHERIHTGEKPHSCEICGKSFRVSYCLTLHMRTHTGARPYSCQLCGKRFKAHSVYNHHLMTHSEVRAYKCPYCPKAFKTSVQLAGHKNSHTKPFSCQQCNRPFASLYAVRVHQETHARPNSLKFSCSLCGASYARAFALKDHMKVAHPKGGVVDTTLNSMLTTGDPLVVSAMSKDWEIKNGGENATEETTIDTKKFTNEEEVSTVMPYDGTLPEN